MSETTMEVQGKEQSEKTSEGERERPNEEPSSGKSASSTSKEKSGRGRALLIFAVVLLIAAAAVFFIGCTLASLRTPTTPRSTEISAPSARASTATSSRSMCKTTNW